MYTSDVADAEWAVLEPLIPAIKSNKKKGGRPAKYERRDIINAILYVKTTGCQWRNMPHDFPYWKTVYGYFYRWSRNGTWEKIHAKLHTTCRDAGKLVKGRKRHILVDTLGYLITVVVHGGNMQDRDGAKLVLKKAKKRPSRLHLVWADGAYAGKLVDWVRTACGWTLEIVKRTDDVQGFKVLPRRWVVERTFAWISKSRRFSREYECSTKSSESFIYIAMIHLMTKQLARGF